jgi:16S rRNA C967 or C1407 C5-methylase (RsmB/RsmF family)
LKESFSLEPLYATFKFENCEPYYLDAASVFASSCLPLENSLNILDMCAAPGGKSLILASRMFYDSSLVCNERSAERRNRLCTVVKESLPEEINSRIQITGNDGALICKKTDKKFDSILLDAPCSSERHVYNSPKHLEQWTASRVKNLSFTQWSLLSSAFLSLKDEGYILYSTCALAEEENDGVIKKLLKKYAKSSSDEYKISIEQIDFENSLKNLPSCVQIPDLIIEKTEFGYQILPDKNRGAGPIYFSLIKKYID